MSLLRELEDTDIKLLRNFLNKKLNTSLSVLALLDIKENFPFSRLIHVSKDDPTKFIFFQNIILKPNSFNVYWDTERVTDTELREYLLSVPDWKWDEKFVFGCIESSLCSKLDLVLRDTKGFTSKLLKTSYSQPYFVLQMKEENILQTSLAEGFKFGLLKDFHIPYLFSKWKYNRDDIIENYQNYIKMFPNTAIFKEDDKDELHPISWILLYNFGIMGILYTDSEYRRLGLGSAVITKLCSILAKRKLLMLTLVDPDNKSSLEMHKKIGFEIVSQMYWNEYECYEN